MTRRNSTPTFRPSGKKAKSPEKMTMTGEEMAAGPLGASRLLFKVLSLFVSLFTCLFICFFVCLFVSLFICLFVCLFTFLSIFFLLQDIVIVSAVASLVTIGTLLLWATVVKLCSRPTVHVSSPAAAVSTPTRTLTDDVELATLSPISTISGPLLVSPLLAPPALVQDERRKSGRLTKRPDFYGSCPDVTTSQ